MDMHTSLSPYIWTPSLSPQGMDWSTWFKMFSAPTFFIYTENNGIILLLMSVVKMVSTDNKVIFNILTTQANNKFAESVIGSTLTKGLGDVMFSLVCVSPDLCSPFPC